MKNVKPIWKPKYGVTTDMARCLMEIEAVRTTVGQAQPGLWFIGNLSAISGWFIGNAAG